MKDSIAEDMIRSLITLLKQSTRGSGDSKNARKAAFIVEGEKLAKSPKNKLWYITSYSTRLETEVDLEKQNV